MLQIRIVVDEEQRPTVEQALTALPGVTNVVTSAPTTAGRRVVNADVEVTGADDALDALTVLGVAPEAVRLVRVEAVQPVERRGNASWLGAAADGPAWVEIVEEARTSARLLVRYGLLMAIAGTIASVGVLDANQILVVGAMAISPDLLPMSAACVGVVGRRPRLAGRALLTLAVGLGIATVAAGVVGRLLEAAGLFGDSPSDAGLGTLTTTDLSTIVIALAAGVAAMLAFETRGASAVGVAISITTIPAAAYLGVVTIDGAAADALGALGVLATNVVCVIAAGTSTLAVQRWWRGRPRARKLSTRTA